MQNQKRRGARHKPDKEDCRGKDNTSGNPVVVQGGSPVSSNEDIDKDTTRWFKPSK